jgi:hypothetical protein
MVNKRMGGNTSGLWSKMMYALIILSLMSFDIKNDLVIKADVNSCDKYRNIKITFFKCNNQYSPEYIASCRVEDNKIIVPNVLRDESFKKNYESANYMKIKLLRGTICDEQIIKL